VGKRWTYEKEMVGLFFIAHLIEEKKIEMFEALKV
jgi:hypothetical protein